MPKISSSAGKGKFNKKGEKLEKRKKTDDDYDHVFQLAVNQEEQGERYQFGPKAKRNFESSINTYQHSIQLLQHSSNPSPLDYFNSHFNLARTLIHLGSSFASARSECVKFLKSGIQEYRQAIHVATVNSNHTDEIDARYNLGLGLSSLADMLSSGAMEDDQNAISHNNEHSMTTAIQLWKEAKEELSRAYKVQDELLVNSAIFQSQVVSEGRTQVQSGELVEETMQNDSPSLENTETALVEEIFVITPSVVIDTLIDICEVLLSICPYEPESTSLELNHYLQQLQRVNQLIENSDSPNFSRRFEIENLICNVDLTMIEHKLSSSSGIDHIFLEIEHLLMSVSQRLELLSKETNSSNQEFFDLLKMTDNFSTLCTTTCSLIILKANGSKVPIPTNQISELEFLFQKTIDFYSAILDKLNQSKLRPIKQINPHEVPSYICSSLIAQSELYLTLELLHRTHPVGEHLPHVDNNGNYQTKSFDLAIEAYNQTFGGYKITKNATHFLKLEFTSRHVSTSNSTEVRNDWPMFSVRLNSIKLILRSKLHHLLLESTSSNLFHGQQNFQSFNKSDLELILRNEILPLIKKFELIKFDLINFLDDFLNDSVFLLSHSVEDYAFKYLLDHST